MQLVTLTVRKPKSSVFKSTVLDAVHAVLVASGVPATEKFQRVIELEVDDFRFYPNCPDLESERNDDFVLIEILWSVGRSVKVKRKLLEQLMGKLSEAGLNTASWSTSRRHPERTGFSAAVASSTLEQSDMRARNLIAVVHLFGDTAVNTLPDPLAQIHAINQTASFNL
ncbi:Tautomerase enzyme [Burkholderia sp. D7]|nr:Tautomerase enzyme [Burkholderia sp. D7]